MAVLFARVFVLLAQVLSSLGTVSGLVAKTSQEHLPYEIESAAVATSLNVGNPTYGLAALAARLTTIETALVSLASAVAAIPTGPQLAGHAVTLPSSAPSGYGSDPSGTAGAVWAYLVAGGTQSAGDLMADAGWLGINMAQALVRFPIGSTKYYEMSGTWWSSAAAEATRDGPIFPIANILSDDTLQTFLERESFWTGWTANGDGTWQVYQDPAHTDFIIYTTITEAEFLVLRDGPAAAGALGVPPVWPGVANVTLGTPVGISTGLSISTPMDGVIVNITGVPTRANFFQFDDKPSYRNLGGLVFVDDDGHEEAPQLLGFESQIFAPRSMKQAAGVKLRTEGGVSGTLTPWTITP